MASPKHTTRSTRPFLRHATREVLCPAHLDIPIRVRPCTRPWCRTGAQILRIREQRLCRLPNRRNLPAHDLDCFWEQRLGRIWALGLDADYTLCQYRTHRWTVKEIHTDEPVAYPFELHATIELFVPQNFPRHRLLPEVPIINRYLGRGQMVSQANSLSCPRAWERNAPVRLEKP